MRFRACTLDVLAELSDSRIRLESGRDGGIYDALNSGIARASGEVVGLLHSDDIYAAPDVLAEVVRAFEDLKVNAVCGDLLHVFKAIRPE
jgi:glycosyltransferase